MASMKIEKAHLTLKLMRSLQTGETRRYCDTDVTGLQVWVGAKTVSYYLRKRSGGKEYAVKLGNWPGMMPEEARLKALDRLGALANHGSIDAPTGRINPVVEDAVKYYMTTIKSIDCVRSSLNHSKHLWQKHISDVTKDDIKTLHESLKATPVAANHAVKVLVAAIHSLCKKIGVSYSSPAEGLQMYKETPRMRYITKEEAPRFFESLESMRKKRMNDMLVDITYMLLYTGARKSNVFDMELQEIGETGLWTIPAEKFKTKREHRIQLGKTELDIIGKYRCGRASGYVFSHEKNIKCRMDKFIRKVCEKAEMEDFHIHDLRRTLGTWMLSNGAPIAVVSKKLGHSSIGITEQVYAHLMPEASLSATSEAIDAMRGIKHNN